MISVEISGLRQINQSLTALPDKLAKTGLRKATRAAAKVVLDAVKLRAPRATGSLVKSFAVRSAVRRSRRKGSYEVGHSVVNRERHQFKGDQFYGGFMELGTKDRYTNTARLRSKGRVVGYKKKDVVRQQAFRGRIDPMRWSYLRPSLYETKESQRSAFIAQMKAWLSTVK